MDPKDYERETDAAVDRFVTKHFMGVDKAPPVLWHYTDAAGFQGMLSSRKVWATHVRFMNDPEEGLHTIELVREKIGQMLPQEPTQSGVAVLKNAIDVCRSGTYFVCLSAESDRLSQWRAYAGHGAGFAIGMHISSVPDHRDLALPTSASFGPFAIRVIYDAEAKHAALDDVFDVASMQSLPEHLRRDQRYQELAINAALRMTNFCAVAFKSPAYEEEAEWRLVWTGPFGDKAAAGARPTIAQKLYSQPSPDVPLRFRQTKHGLAPYLDWPLARPAKPVSSVIKAVRRGPKHAADSPFSVSMFLDWEGYVGVEIQRSSAVYR